MLYEYLVNHYKEGEPIFLTDIVIPGISEENIRQKLKILTDSGRICRFEQGVYYIPKQSRLKGTVSLSPELVAYSKYIERAGRIMGYYSGYTLANRMGISTQVPLVEEIVSNNMAAIVREVKVGPQKYIVRRPFTQVNNDNYPILQLLDLLKDIDKYEETNRAETKELLSKYIRENHISRDQVDRVIGAFPLKTYKAIYDMRLDYVFA